MSSHLIPNDSKGRYPSTGGHSVKTNSSTSCEVKYNDESQQFLNTMYAYSESLRVEKIPRCIYCGQKFIDGGGGFKSCSSKICLRAAQLAAAYSKFEVNMILNSVDAKQWLRICVIVVLPNVIADLVLQFSGCIYECSNGHDNNRPCIICNQKTTVLYATRLTCLYCNYPMGSRYEPDEDNIQRHTYLCGSLDCLNLAYDKYDGYDTSDNKMKKGICVY